MKRFKSGIAAVATAVAALMALPATAAYATNGGQYVSWPGGGESIVWPIAVDSNLRWMAAHDAPNGFCFTAQLSDIGWDGYVSCMNSSGGSGNTVLAVGQDGHRIEAIAFAPGPNVAEMCLQAHVQNIGWQDGNCATPGLSSAVGTTGMALNMEDLRIWASGTDFGATAQLTDGEVVGSSTCVSTLGPDTLGIGTTGLDLGLVSLVLGSGC
jgi:hypothetical protein